MICSRQNHSKDEKNNSMKFKNGKNITKYLNDVNIGNQEIREKAINITIEMRIKEQEKINIFYQMSFII